MAETKRRRVQLLASMTGAEDGGILIVTDGEEDVWIKLEDLPRVMSVLMVATIQAGAANKKRTTRKKR